MCGEAATRGPLRPSQRRRGRHRAQVFFGVPGTKPAELLSVDIRRSVHTVATNQFCCKNGKPNSMPLQVMAEMRHPHVVQFLGLCYLEGSPLPVLVMEKLDSSLDHLLETSPNLTLGLKLSLLTDVARGLVYLHTRNPPVVHRDLSARNVLLTSAMVAKISDLGNARIVSLLPGQLARTLTCIPGTQVYMPPESFDEGSRYGPRLDIFSFGHLALYTLTQVRRFIDYGWKTDNTHIACRIGVTNVCHRGSLLWDYLVCLILANYFVTTSA